MRRPAGTLLPLGMACLVSCLLPAGAALALTPARQPAADPAWLVAGNAVAGPLPPPPAAIRPAPAGPNTLAPEGTPPLRPGQRSAEAASPAAGSLAGAGSPAAISPVALPQGMPPAAPISEIDFQKLLRTADLDRLDLLCRQLVEAGDDSRLRLLRERLLTIHPAPQPLAVVLANAEVLLSCRMPDGALTVLDRIGPAPGAEQVQWLTLQWRAANAALDHRRAALALERLAAEGPARLESLLLPLQQRSDGSWASRSALEMLASHLESGGQSASAAALLLLSRNQDAAAAERLAKAARLLADLPAEQREPLFERALEQAAAAGSWGLVGELLAAQASLPSSPETAARTAERRLRLSRRLDDAYGEWRTLQDAADPASAARRQALRQQLRSPQAAGGHAESLPAPAPLPPTFSARSRARAPGQPSAAPPSPPSDADESPASASPSPSQP